MITGEIKSQVDKVWEAFWTGGVSNPLTVIEQITYLIFIRRLDEMQVTKEKQANLLGIAISDGFFKYEREIYLNLTFPAKFKFTRGNWNSEAVINKLSGQPKFILKY